jgi:hypothetical protein
MSKLSESLKKRWQDPEYRAIQTAARKTANIKRSEAMKKEWQDPEKRANRVESARRLAHNIDVRAMRSRLMVERWKNPEQRAKLQNGNRKHGLAGGPEYFAYHGARQRCTNPKDPQWSSYGGRGITFGFVSFDEFFAHVGLRPSAKHSLDRLDNNKGYELGNVGWRTASEQQYNRRHTACLTRYTDAELLAEIQRRGLKP